MRLKYPKTYAFFVKYKNILEKRSIYKLWGRNDPFYSVYDIGSYTFYPYKIAWKYISGKISGKGDFKVTVLSPVKDKFLNEVLTIPDGGTVIFIPILSEDEAYYISAVLNSSPIIFLINSYAMEIHASTYVIDPIKISKFNPENIFHQKLSKLSKRAHELARKIYEEGRDDLRDDLKRIEEEIDNTVAKLYGITDEELREIRKCLMILKEGEVLEEEEEGEEESIIMLRRNIDVKVDPLLIFENEVNDIKVSVTNNLTEDLRDFNLKVLLDGKQVFEGEVEILKSNGSKVFVFKSPKLMKGQYKLEVYFSYRDKSGRKVFKEERTLFVKTKVSRKKKTIFDTELDEFLEGV